MTTRTGRIAGALVLVAVLSTGFGLARGAGALSFSDVPGGSFFELHIDWLTDQGVATGYNDGTFRPNNPITRGQMAFWLGNYNDRFELVTVSAPANASSFLSYHEVVCPAGKRALLGGGKTSTTNLFIANSGPATNASAELDRWAVQWRNEERVDIGAGVTVDVWALCGPALVGP